jgi:hypothetical protein
MLKACFLITLPILFSCILAIAKPFSYIYIQGDKITPFYVKLEGKMMPRYGKNYCIIPRLKEGSYNIEILFQQNIYPPEQFTIQVPGNGYRGFLLVSKQETQFALYDIENKTYLEAKH